MDFGFILKPVLLMNGIRDFQIRLDSGQRTIVLTGTKQGRPFSDTMTFAELENMINGTPETPAAEQDTTQEPQEANTPPQTTGQGGNVQPERS
jgi:hypothetical protein